MPVNKETRVFYLLSPDYTERLRVLTASELADLLGIDKRYLDSYLVKHSTYKGYPIAEE